MGLRTFSFDGISSDTFNLFINEAGPHGAPERAVEMLEIPGRNGFYALDQGRFNNTEVTYHVVVDGSDDADFSEEIADVREWLCSGTGYKRLEDDYNPNEYRMAVFRNGFETDEAFWNGAEFDITFDCKPQRWLTSGETAVSVTSGNTITNPTLFDAEPLLEVKGYGGIEFNGYSINVKNALIGNMQIMSPLVESVEGIPNNWTRQYDFVHTSRLKNGDEIYFSHGSNDLPTFLLEFGGSTSNAIVTSSSGFQTFYVSAFSRYLSLNHKFSDKVLYYGTSDTWSATATVSFKVGGESHTLNVGFSFSYNGTNKVTETVTYDYGSAEALSIYYPNGIIANSTKSALGNPSYIDCDIGEAYLIDDGEMIQLNKLVSLGSDLPKLAPGSNTITYDNTVTELKIHPRWWRV